MAKKFSIEVRENWCKGCGLCVALCPKQVIEMSEIVKAVAARQEDCIGCRQCENICPDLAITVKECE